MQSSKTCAASRCPMMLDRRGLLRSAGAVAGAAAAAEMGLLDFASSMLAEEATTRPAGGPVIDVVSICPKTSDLDDVSDSGDTKGFHQLFIHGDLERQFKAYCKLAGIEVVHI